MLHLVQVAVFFDSRHKLLLFGAKITDVLEKCKKICRCSPCMRPKKNATHVDIGEKLFGN